MLAKILNTFGARSLAAILNLLIAIVLSQFIGPVGKGQQGLIITTIAFILVFSNLIGGATLVYLVPRYKTPQLFLPSYFWSILISVMAYAILYFFPVIDRSYSFHIAILSAINSFSSINSNILIGKEKIKDANLISLLQPLVTVLILILLFAVFSMKNVYAYIVSLYISFFIGWLSGIVLLRKTPLILNFSLGESIVVVRDMFKFGFLNQLAHITQLMSFRLSYYILNTYHGEGSVGIYSNGIALMESVWLISKSISLVQYARIANTGDDKYARTLTIRLIQASLAISIMIILVFLIMPEAFYIVLFGEGFAGIKLAMWSLAPGILIYNINILTGHYFSGRGKYHFNTIASSAGLLVSILMFYLLIPTYEVAGAGWATSISYLATSVIIVYFFFRNYKLDDDDWKINRNHFRELWKETLNMLKISTQKSSGIERK